jgi:hypothetical protein
MFLCNMRHSSLNSAVSRSACDGFRLRTTFVAHFTCIIRVSMNRYFKALSFIAVPAMVSGQDIYQQHLRQLTQAELSFASMAEKGNTRKAFLGNLDSAGVLFNGPTPVNGVELYTKVTENARELLKWFPSFAEVSESGDYGFTTGPFWYYEERGGNQRSSGHFFTIWRRDNSGQFKVWLDAGITNSYSIQTLKDARRLQDVVDHQYSKAVLNRSQVKAEPQQLIFFQALATGVESAYRSFLGDSAVLLRKDEPVTNSKLKNINIATRAHQANNIFVPERHAYNNNGTMYFSHGSVNDAADKKRKGYFVQVWQFQKNGWQIIADVVNIFPVKGA